MNEVSPKDVVLLPNSARTDTTSSTWESNFEGHVGVIVNLDITTLTAGASLTLTIEGLDVASNKAFALLTSAAVTAVGTYTYYLMLGMSEIANKVVNAPLPAEWRVTVTPVDSKSVTYSVGACVIGL